MASRNKNTITVTILIIALIAFTIGSVIFTKDLSPMVVVGISILIVYLVAVPMFNRRYCKLLEEDCGFISSYLPVYNEMSIFSPAMSYTCIALFIICAILGFVTLAPTTILGTIIGVEKAALIPMKIKGIFYMSVIVLNIAIGISYSVVFKQVNTLYNTEFEPSAGVTNGFVKVVSLMMNIIPFAQPILLCIPLLRGILLLTLAENMRALLDCNITFYSDSKHNRDTVDWDNEDEDEEDEGFSEPSDWDGFDED